MPPEAEKQEPYWKKQFILDADFSSRNPCHNFVTLRTKFSVIRPYRKTDYVTVISCINLQVPETERVW